MKEYQLGGDPSHLTSFGRFVAHHLSSRGRRDGRVDTGVKPRLVARGIGVQPRQLGRYLRATGGEHIALLGQAVLLPPSIPAIWETACVLDLLRLADFPLPTAGLLHLGGERVHIRPMRAADRFELRMRLLRVEPGRESVKVAVGSRLSAQTGQLCSESELWLLVRGVGARGGGHGRRSSASAVSPELNWTPLCTWDLPGSAGRRYALASGDANPIHLYGATARLFGFKRPILHGYCSEAMIAHALIANLFSGDPRALRKLRIRFTAPLLLPARAVLHIAPDESGAAGAFELRPDEGGRPFAKGDWSGAGDGLQG